MKVLSFTRNCLLILLMVGSGSTVWAQQEMTLHYMSQLQQSRQTNPALFPEKTVNFTLPGVSTMVFNFANSGFVWRDLIHTREQDDSTVIDVNNVVNKIGQTNFIYTHYHWDLLNVGFRARKLYFDVSVIEKFHSTFKYPRDFMRLMFNGNSGFIGQTVELGLALKTVHYREMGLGVAYKYEDWTFGAKFKYLQGLANISTSKNSITLFTDPESYGLTFASDYRINTSGLSVLSGSGNLDVSSYLLNFENPGYGFDLGATYNFQDRFLFTASVLDISQIQWKSNLKNYHSNGSFTFEGIDLNQYFFVDSNDANAPGQFSLNSILDTLQERFGFDTSEIAYQTSVIPKVMLSGRMKLDSVSQIGISFYGEFFDGLQPAVMVMYSRKVGKAFSFVSSVSYKNRSPLNIGLGWVLTAGPVQFFAVGGNLSAFVAPRRTKSFNLRAGMQFAFGSPKLRPTEAPTEGF